MTHISTGKGFIKIKIFSRPKSKSILIDSDALCAGPKILLNFTNFTRVCVTHILRIINLKGNKI